MYVGVVLYGTIHIQAWRSRGINGRNPGNKEASLAQLIFFHGYSIILRRILGINERVIHISHKLSTVNGDLSTFLRRNQFN
jgi:hypothetical protein